MKSEIILPASLTEHTSRLLAGIHKNAINQSRETSSNREILV
jgi:hypothetical protein